MNEYNDLVCHACDGTGGDCVHGMCWECSGSGMVGSMSWEYGDYAREMQVEAEEEERERATKLDIWQGDTAV